MFDSQIIVNPDAAGLERCVNPRHFANIRQKCTLPRTTAVLVFHTGRAGPARPILGGAVLECRELVAMPQRSLYLKARCYSELAQLRSVDGKATGMVAVMLERRQANPRREPYLVATAGILLERGKRLLPLLLRCRMRNAQAHGNYRAFANRTQRTKSQQQTCYQTVFHIHFILSVVLHENGNISKTSSSPLVSSWCETRQEERSLPFKVTRPMRFVRVIGTK